MPLVTKKNKKNQTKKRQTDSFDQYLEKSPTVSGVPKVFNFTHQREPSFEVSKQLCAAQCSFPASSARSVLPSSTDPPNKTSSLPTLHIYSHSAVCFLCNIPFCELTSPGPLHFSLDSAFLTPWPLPLPVPGLPPTHLPGEAAGTVPGDPCPGWLLHEFCLLVTRSWKDPTPSQQWEVADQRPLWDGREPPQTSPVSWKVGAPLCCLSVLLWLHPH